jgi:phage terminase small subunit
MKKMTPKQKKFADLRLEGLPAGIAYSQAGYSSAHPRVDARKLLKHETVAAYIAAQQEILNERCLLNQVQVMNYLTHVIMTPIGRLDEESPLAQEFSNDLVGKETMRKRVKMIGKMDAIKQLCNMMGWNAPQQHHVEVSSELAEMVRKARAGGGKKVDS